MSTLFAAFERVPQMPAQVAWGLSHFVPDGTPSLFLTHPASLALGKQIEFSLFYGSPFGLAPLTHSGATAVFPFRLSNLGIAFTTLGDKLYRETTLSFAGGRQIGQHMQFGLGVDGYELSIQNYGSQRTVGITASMNYDVGETVQWSLLYRNLNAPRLGTTHELLPQVIATGFTFSPTGPLALTSEVERDLRFETRYKFGLRWRPLDVLSLITGFASNPAQVTAGIVLELLGQEISYAIATHPELDVSHLLALQFRLP